MRPITAMRLAMLACLPAYAAASQAQALPAVANFFETPRVSRVALSPKGDHVAVIMMLKDGTQALVVRETANPEKARMLTRAEAKDFSLRDVQWVNNRRVAYTVKNLAYAAETALDEFAVDIDGKDQRKLIAGDWRFDNTKTGSKMISRTITSEYGVYGTLNDGSDDVLVMLYKWNNKDIASNSSRLYRLDSRTQQLKAAFEGAQPPAIKDWLTDRNGVPRVATTVLQGRCIVSYRKPDDTAWTEISNKECISDQQFVPRFFDGEQALFVQSGDKGYAALYRYDLKTMKLDAEPMVETAGFDFAGYPEYDDISKRVVGLHFRTDAKSSIWLHPQLKAEQAKIDAALPNSINTVHCAADCLGAPVLVVQIDSDRMPTEYALYTRATGDLVGLGAAHPAIRPAEMGQRSFHRYTARDGRSIPAYVTLPPGKSQGPRPAVVLVHGGPHVRGSSWEWNDEAAFLASRGYVVIQPEFRGSAGFGGEHTEAGFRQWGGTMQDDLADAALWAVKQVWADARRVGIMGASYGGYATLMGLIKDPGIFRAGVAWASVTDIDLMFTSNESDTTVEHRNYSMRTMIGDPDRDAEKFRRNSPVHRAAELKQPLLLAHGFDDLRTPVSHATSFYRAVKAGNSKATLLTYNNEGHGWRNEATRIDFWQKVETFLDTNLKHAE